MPRKILYAASTMGHLNSFHLPYLERLSREGWEVHIAARDAVPDTPGAARAFDLPFEKSMFSPKNLRAVLLLIRILRQERYDAVSVHTALAAFFVRLAVMLSGLRKEILVVNTVHGYLFDRDTPLLKRTVLLWAEKLTAPATDLLLTMNRQDEEIARTHRLCAGEILPTRGMGVRFEPFRPADSTLRLQARRRFRLPENAFVLLYAAEFSARKNQAELIRALPHLPEQVCLLLAGRGAGLEQCRALAERLQVSSRVVFAGFVPDVQACCWAADACVSASRSEGLPFNLMEAMYSALPVAATRVKGHEDLIEDGKTGLLFPFGDREQLCAKICALLESPPLRMRLGYQARETAARYGLEQVLEENMECLNSFFRAHGLEPAPAASRDTEQILTS